MKANGIAKSWFGVCVPALFSVLLLTVLALGSSAPLSKNAETAVLRLAWRFANAKVSLCHELTDQQLKKTAAHMRQAQVCKNYFLPYKLRVKVDGALMLEKTFSHTGMRSDRPLFVFEDLKVEPKSSLLEIDFSPTEVSEQGLEGALQSAETLHYKGQVSLSRARITMIAVDAESRHLKVASPIE